MTEQWRRVPGYEKYQVSDQGRVLGPRRHVLRPRPLKTGHLVVYLSGGRAHVGHTYSIRRLMYTAFIGPIPEGMIILLKDKAQPETLDNLLLGTYSDAFKHRRKRSKRPTKGLHKLPRILQLYERGYPIYQIAPLVGVSPPTVSKLLRESERS